MSADGSDYGIDQRQDDVPFTGLKGVEELVGSKGLEILRGTIDGAQVRALIDLARLLAEHEAAGRDAA